MLDTSHDPYIPGRKDSSLEMTAVRPPPRVSVAEIEAIGLDPDHPETKEMIARAGESPEDDDDSIKDRETIARCPVCIACACCGGKGTLTIDEAAAYEAAQQELVEPSEPDDAA